MIKNRPFFDQINRKIPPCGCKFLAGFWSVLVGFGSKRERHRLVLASFGWFWPVLAQKRERRRLVFGWFWLIKKQRPSARFKNAIFWWFWLCLTSFSSLTKTERCRTSATHLSGGSNSPKTYLVDLGNLRGAYALFGKQLPQLSAPLFFKRAKKSTPKVKF